MPNYFWKELMIKVERIVKLKLSELTKVGLKQRLKTLGKVFKAREVTLEGNLKTIIYKDKERDS